MNPTIAVFGSSRAESNDPVYRDAVRLGRVLAESGCVVANGGYGGLMEATSIGAAQGGGTVIGVSAPKVFPNRDGTNHAVTSEIQSETIAGRIAQLVDMSDATISLPGSLGTTAEFVTAWNTGFVAQLIGKPAKLNVAVGPRWRRLVDHLSHEIGADSALVTCVDSMSEAADVVLQHFDLPRRS